ncbi:MAG: LysM peptidoglycan-binding domain-containing M23 family metallopeptidase [Alphaproteobacteria bacterium]|nr:LysM peptidoglycan-binding domain-containing M23 family metallopeptidase [Alphaproteobacteria bacterium]
MSGIAARFEVSPLELARDNRIAAPYQVRIGQVLRLPAHAAAPVVATLGPGTPSPRTGKLRFQWPVQGEVLSTFGPKGRGLHNDGINIAVPVGTEVRAAESGVVAYVGNELRGFGHLVLIRHTDGWVTAYAHNAEILVERGVRVERGQLIARAGASGHVSRPQLHFEVRKGVDAVDPLRHLPARKTAGRLA